LVISVVVEILDEELKFDHHEKHLKGPFILEGSKNG
jgi:hypothetical protein